MPFISLNAQAAIQIPMPRDSSTTTVNPGDPARLRTDRMMSRPKSAKYLPDFSMLEFLRHRAQSPQLTSSDCSALAAFGIGKRFDRHTQNIRKPYYFYLRSRALRLRKRADCCSGLPRWQLRLGTWKRKRIVDGSKAKTTRPRAWAERVRVCSRANLYLIC
jgi:hypothetical protein